MGPGFFSPVEIEDHFYLKTCAPILPASLTIDALSAPCPYQQGKKVHETHFLFCIPSYIHGGKLEGSASFKTAEAQAEYALDFIIQNEFITIQLNGIIDDAGKKIFQKINKEMMPLEGKWVLFYLEAPTGVKKGYRAASLQEWILYFSFWTIGKMQMQSGSRFLTSIKIKEAQTTWISN